ncbi:MAG: hypothetical protein HQL84_07270 [Magnetococcales bacterium]|nr:hypothetical protein [Magnetococcales bacterium]MBF0149830.1 hypothetical protein [Magnetococcales bacterium]MBF0346568.1 hypothetical protein [Magnetococcales bacterium]MBF0631126.1 hypothetical protein [Magnetococcales bacterium]
MRTRINSNRFVVVLVLVALVTWVKPAWAVLQHGHYCGVDNNQWEKSPISAIDVACRNHDLCYMRPGGMGACICDRMLVQDAHNIITYCQETNDPRFLPCGKGFAQMVIMGFALKPCQNNQTIAPGGHDGWFLPLGQSLFGH